MVFAEAKMALLTISMDEGLKEQAEALFSELGVSTGMAINALVRQAERRREIPPSDIDDDDQKPLLISDKICPYCHQRHVYRGREMREALEEADRISRDPTVKGHTFAEFLAEMHGSTMEYNPQWS
jgi:DNA-damage-inducible protein J